MERAPGEGWKVALIAVALGGLLAGLGLRLTGRADLAALVWSLGVLPVLGRGLPAPGARQGQRARDGVEVQPVLVQLDVAAGGTDEPVSGLVVAVQGDDDVGPVLERG